MKDYKDEESSGLGYFITGTVVGAVLTLLFAPQTGEETRKGIGDFWNKNSEKGRDLVNRVMEKVPGRVKAAAMGGAIKEGGQEAFREAKQGIEDRIS